MSNSQSNPDVNDGAVSFVQMLREELAEIATLRRERQWEDGEDTCKVPAAEVGPQPSCDPEVLGAQPGATGTVRREANHETDNEAHDDATFRQAHHESLVGLSFSGGGIRSATFNLGVLQGLADLRLLPMFDYLSTVSGGGYIGSWLYAWIYRAGLDPKVARCKKTSPGDDQSSPIRRVQECLNPDRSTKPDHAEARPIRFLREYSNYLTPRLGFLGADTWTAIAIYLRNLLLNQLILISFLASILLLPHIAISVTTETTKLTCFAHPYFLAPEVAAVLIVLALTFVFLNMKHLTGIDPGPKARFPWYSQQGWVLSLVAAPLFIAAWLAGAWLWHRLLSLLWWQWAGIGCIVFGGLWSAASLWDMPESGPAAPHWSKKGAWYWSIFASLISGSAGGILLGVLTNEWFVKAAKDHSASGISSVVSFGTPLIVVIFLLVGALQIGLMGLYFPDPRREWWGRLGGYLFIISIVWTAVFLVSIYSPLGWMWIRGRMREGLGLVWVVSTLTGVLGGKSASTGALESPTWKDMALSVTPYVFIVGIASGIALLLEICLAVLNGTGDCLATFLQKSPAAQKVSAWVISVDYTATFGDFRSQGKMMVNGSVSPPASYLQAHWHILSATELCLLLSLFVGLLTVCVFLSWRVNLNEFSLNLFYRNRLVRAYLGASHTGRKPNPFTGFDPDDELYLRQLRSDQCYSGPFPIVNSALNLVSGKDLAWQERKAESFVFTPLRCGFDTWLERIDLNDEYFPIQTSPDVQRYGFRPTSNYAFKKDGLRLGTVVSISGAAASPNMGYHSSPSLAFLMTLFDVRLGFWAGNPRHNAGWQNPGPRVGLVYLLAELFGQSDDESRYVYLSDGGHFENLGLYELVKRRCKYIIVCDAGCDGDYAFGDLGNAIRRCREDIGVSIDLSISELTPETPSKNDARSAVSTDNLSEWHWAVGTINYSLLDPGAGDGILVYLKTSITGDEPPDVLNYHREHPEFPHQTTGDQWFTESQFESYRRLGQHVVEQLFDPVKQIVSSLHNRTQNGGGTSTKDLFEGLRDQWMP